MSQSFLSRTLGAVLLLLAATTAIADGPEVYGTFDGDDMYTLLPPDGIPAIQNPTYVTGKEASAQMSATEPVMGMVVGGDAICWSTWQLDRHEIVNDSVAGAAVAVTW